LLYWLQQVLLVYATLSLLTYLGPYFLQAFTSREQNLKKKYGSKWALVTGASSGIGRAITEKLAAQGINVVLVALDDHFLRELHKRLQKEYKDLEFRAVGVDLGLLDGGYMKPILQATEDLEINLLFNNAGYVTVGLFSDMSLERSLKNFEVNAVCSIKITHHFLNKMLATGKKGAIIFTSSSGGAIPNPLHMMYGSTKAFLTEFAASLAGEVYASNIDVLVIHPSPVDTEFYKSETAHKSGALQASKKYAVPPSRIADTIFKSLGSRFCVIRDQGWFTVAMHLLLKVIDYNFIATATTLFTHRTPEYKNLVAERQKKK